MDSKQDWQDMQAIGLFRAVFSRYAVKESRFLLQEGGVGEFFMCLEKNSKIAVISMEITLKDAKQSKANKRIVFQKNTTMNNC
jgi:hypothetical protein